MAVDDDEYPHPPGPPPVLDIEQLKHLCRYGWLSYELPASSGERLARLFSLAGDFFDQDTGKKQALYPPSRGTECGFYRVDGEKEYVTLRRQIHDDLAFEAEASQAWKEIAQLLHLILIDLSRAEGMATTAWDSMVGSSLSLPALETNLDDVITLMRIFRYYPTTGVADPHTDLGLLTLCVGDGEGLEVFDTSVKPPQWRPAARATILVGETLRKLSGGIIRAGLHRVVGNSQGRSSIVFALRPDLEGSIDMTAFGGEGVVEARGFYADVKARKYNVNAKPEMRKAQKQANQEAPRTR